MAFSLNQATVLGNLVRDIELRYTPNGSAVAKLSIATNRSYKDKNEQWQQVAEYHNCTVWGNAAEKLAELAHKGDKILVQGRLETQKWDDKNSGVTRYNTQIVVDTYILLTPRKKEDDVEAPVVEPEGGVPEAEGGEVNTDPSNSEEVNVDDIPF